MIRSSPRVSSCKRYCQLSINLSGQSLGDPRALASYIENKLEEYELDGQDICFEITESAAIENLAEASDFIEQVRVLGCKFSLDDFGTGLSSFSCLTSLNVDYLKIDGSFVGDIVFDPVSESMVAAINQVGRRCTSKPSRNMSRTKTSGASWSPWASITVRDTVSESRRCSVRFRRNWQS